MEKKIEINQGEKECILTKVTNEDLELLKSNPEAFWAGVTAIGEEAFEYCDGLEEIVIPEGITRIGYHAFNWCKNLKRVVIPKSVTKIGCYAFENCRSLNDIVIPEGVREIWDYAFKNCKSLKRIVIPEGVTEIAWGLFCGCSSLTDATISNSVRYIKADAFKWCKSLKRIIIPGGVVHIQHGVFRCCKNLERVVLPNSMTEIYERDRFDNKIFDGCGKLRSMSIPFSFEGVDLELFKIDDEFNLRNNKFFKEGEFIVEYEKNKFAKIKSQDVLADKWVEKYEELDRLALKELREMVKEKVQNGELEEVADPRIKVNNAKIAIANAASCVPPTNGEKTTKKEVEEPKLNKLTTKKDEQEPRDR